MRLITVTVAQLKEGSFIKRYIMFCLKIVNILFVVMIVNTEVLLCPSSISRRRNEPAWFYPYNYIYLSLSLICVVMSGKYDIRSCSVLSLEVISDISTVPKLP